VNELFGRRLLDAQIDDLVAIRRAAFVGCIEAEPSTHRVLELLGSRYRLGLLSNYPCGRSIRASLEATGLERHFAAVVVSGDVGFVKPHPRTFEAILERLRLPAGRTAFVGDNWLADVQGSKRAGMTCVHMRRWTPPERFEPQPGDFEPDCVVRNLGELLELFEPGVPPG
jgi:putative hydrolase of the HAD superfamily